MRSSPSAGFNPGRTAPVVSHMASSFDATVRGTLDAPIALPHASSGKPRGKGRPAGSTRTSPATIMIATSGSVRNEACGLLGRDHERTLLSELVSAVCRGESRSLVLRGEAGIGKSALLQNLIESASEMTVLRAVGVEWEMELAYASLHQLCGPLLERLERLPVPQRRALEIVFGLSLGPAPDRFLVGLGVLGLLSEAAEKRPLLCVVDDAQWLDRTSAQTLAFVARRLMAESVGIVFAAREPVGIVFASGDPREELDGLPELRVDGLGNCDARSLLSSVVRIVLEQRVLDRIVAETRGNPLALLELPRGLTGTQLAGGFGLLAPQSLPGRIEESFLRRFESLSEQTKLLLLVAAAEPVGDPRFVWSAAERLGLPILSDHHERDRRVAGNRRAGDFPSPLGALGGLSFVVGRSTA